MTDTRSDPFMKLVLGVLTSLLVASVIGTVKLYADMQVMRRDVTALSQDKQRDEDQDKRLEELRKTDGKHWRYLVHLNSQADAVNFHVGLPPSPPPDLGD